jgi:hypothetical protein
MIPMEFTVTPTTDPSQRRLKIIQNQYKEYFGSLCKQQSNEIFTDVDTIVIIII